MEPLVCGTCTLCCEVGRIPIQKADVGYETEMDNGKRVIRHERGKCVYLDAGCKVYAKQPSVCAVFDCRAYYQAVYAMPAAERKKRYAVPGTAAVLRRGAN